MSGLQQLVIMDCFAWQWWKGQGVSGVRGPAVAQGGKKEKSFKPTSELKILYQPLAPRLFKDGLLIISK